MCWKQLCWAASQGHILSVYLHTLCRHLFACVFLSVFCLSNPLCYSFCTCMCIRMDCWLRFFIHTVITKSLVTLIALCVLVWLFSNGSYHCSCKLHSTCSVYSKTFAVAATGNVKWIILCVTNVFLQMS